MRLFAIILILAAPLHLFSFSSENQNPKTVYKIYEGKYELELLRLYKDDHYEHIKYLYSNTGKVKCKRNSGSYKTNGTQLHLGLCNNKEFTSVKIKSRKLYYNSKGLFNSLARMIGKPDAGTKTSKTIYKMPWYLEPKSVTTLSNISDTTVTVQALTEFLVEKSKSEEEKVKVIAEFITNSLSYGYGDAGQADSRAMLFGKKKMAVCAGYSHLFREMCGCADILSRRVCGAVRTGFNDICSINYSHAWNTVRVDSIWYSMDVTWMDPNDEDWYMVNPNTMVHSHYSDNPKLRLTKEYVSPDSIITLPLVYPRQTNRLERIYVYPRSPIVFVEDNFVFKIKSSKKIRLKTWPNELLKIRFEGEPSTGPSSFTSKSLDTKTNFKNGFAETKIALEDSITLIAANSNGIGTFHYLVVKGNEKTLLKHFISSSNPKNRCPLTNALLAALILKDKGAYVKLIGDNYKIALKYEEALKSDYYDQIKNWNYVTWGGINNSGFSERGQESVASVVFTADGHKINFGKKDDSYFPLSFELEKWDKFED
ncbi:MAG: hypothetical protein ACI9J3_000711 [Parvicellaceae bacterium]|jgi:hypothetical protein